MDMYVTDNQPSASQREVCTRHRGRQLFWKISARTPQQDFDIFKEINEYWATLPMEHQDAIFAEYEQARSYFGTIFESDRLMDALRPTVARLFDLHPQEKLDYWVRMKSDLLIPTDIPREFDPAESSRKTAERTYIEEDYRKLVPMAISLRLMIPIWGEFLKLIDKETKSAFKEYTAFKLMATANVMQCSAMRRLMVYVSHTIPKDKSTDAAVIYGLGTEDFPEWVLGNTVVSRLCRSDVSGVGDNPVLITYLHNYIREHPGVIEAQMGMVRHKHPEERDDDTNYSALEGFRIKESVAAGDIALIETFVNRAVMQVIGKEEIPLLALCNRLATPIGEPIRPAPREFIQLVQAALKSAKTLTDERIKHSQVTLTGWVLAEQIPIRSIPHLRKNTLLRMMAFAQAYLWYNGHKDLAVLITARAIEDNGGADRVMGDQRDRINRKQLEELQASFPYQRRSGSRSANARSTMMVFGSIENVSKELGDYDWTISAPENWLLNWEKCKSEGGQIDRRFHFPNDIQPQVANLVLELEQRRARAVPPNLI